MQRQILMFIVSLVTGMIWDFNINISSIIIDIDPDVMFKLKLMDIFDFKSENIEDYLVKVTFFQAIIKFVL